MQMGPAYRVPTTQLFCGELSVAVDCTLWIMLCGAWRQNAPLCGGYDKCDLELASRARFKSPFRAPQLVSMLAVPWNSSG